MHGDVEGRPMDCLAGFYPPSAQGDSHPSCCCSWEGSWLPSADTNSGRNQVGAGSGWKLTQWPSALMSISPGDGAGWT